MGFPDGKAFAPSVGDPGSIPGSGRSPGEENNNPLQYSCIKNSMDGGAWWATVRGGAKSRTQLSDLTFTLCFIDYAKAFDCRSQQTVENSSGDGDTRPPYLPPVKPV